MNTATDYTGMNRAKPLQENLVSLVAIYETFVTDKGIIVAATGGVGMKDLNNNYTFNKKTKEL
jgi:hypothetical protein